MAQTANGIMAATAELSVEMNVAAQTLEDMLAGEGVGHAKVQWDPGNSKDWDNEKPTQQCFLRIKRDIMSIYSEPPPGMCVVPEKDDWTLIHALITGPFDTPYEGGFFYFMIRCPPDYPIRPPRVKLVTTGDGQVRFNPNLYKNGKVCLSILGTWSGPAWSPAQSLASVLISIQSLLNEKPYHNEPGFEHERTAGDAKRYNEIIRHETLRVAVCDMLEGKCKCPNELVEVMKKSFPAYYAYYISSCQGNLHQNGQTMQDPFGERRGKFDFQTILKRLEVVKEKNHCDDDVLSDMDSSSDSENDSHLKDSATNATPPVAIATDAMETDTTATGTIPMATHAVAETIATGANSFPIDMEAGPSNSHNDMEPMS